MRSLPACLLLVAGCSADMVSAPTESVPLLPGPGAGINAPAPTSAVASICRVNAWTNMAGVADNVALAVAPSPQGGAAIVQAPTAGGAVTGFAFDVNGIVIGAQNGTTLRDGAYTAVSATYVDGQLLTESTDASSLRLDTVAPDLSSVTAVAAFDGSFAGHAPVLHARANLVAPTAGRTGVSFAALDRQWHQTASVFAFHDTTLGMDSAQLGGDTGDVLVAWTTSSACYTYRLMGESLTSQAGECQTPRLATGDGRELLAYAAGGHVSVADLGADGKAFQTAGYGKQPRLAWDGERMWLAYVDADNNVTAGYFDTHGNFASTSVDIQPQDHAYELAFVNGAMSVFAEDHRGVYQYELCASSSTAE